MAILLKGSKGPQVTALQEKLNSLGYKLKVDGDFGKATDDAVRLMQARFHLVVDGKVGPKTWAFLDTPNETLLRLTEEDYQWAADYLSDDVPSIKAVNTVESPNGGFLKDGRVIILYERHVMYRRLYANGFNPDLYTTSHSDVVNKKTGGYLGNAREYPRLEKAKKIDVVSALESCSWGAYQIMGYHWELLGFNSVHEFVEKMSSGERGQLECFVKFIKANPILLKAIREDDWVTFARHYNGVNYRKNNYDVKLEKAFKLHGGK